MEQARVLPRIGRSPATLLLVAAVLVGVIGAGFVAQRAGTMRDARSDCVDITKPASWTAAAPLPVPEVSQAALLLANGDVLMTGGEDVKDGRPTRVVQRYHTAAGTWSTVAAMRQERIGHTVTLLKDGRVLAVGGLGKKLQPLSSVEIYDPVRDRWASTVPLPDVRFSHSATLLPDGRVLVVGGIVHGTISRSVLIFDPRKPAWRAGPPTLSPHAQQDALALPDGRVLIAGGYGGKAEVYDPRAGRWTEVEALTYSPIRFLPPCAMGMSCSPRVSTTRDRPSAPPAFSIRRRTAGARPQRWPPGGTPPAVRSCATAASWLPAERPTGRCCDRPRSTTGGATDGLTPPRCFRHDPRRRPSCCGTDVCSSVAAPGTAPS